RSGRARCRSRRFPPTARPAGTRLPRSSRSSRPGRRRRAGPASGSPRRGAHPAARQQLGAMGRVVAALVVPSLIAACAGPRREPAVRGLPKDDPAAPLSIVWVGHATVLIRLGRRYVLTDPNLGSALFV